MEWTLAIKIWKVLRDLFTYFLHNKIKSYKLQYRKFLNIMYPRKIAVNKQKGPKWIRLYHQRSIRS